MSDTQYRSVKTGNVLERRNGQFYFQGMYWPGLVDVEVNALYDDPENSFCKAVGIPTAIERKLIEEVKEVRMK